MTMNFYLRVLLFLVASIFSGWAMANGSLDIQFSPELAMKELPIIKKFLDLSFLGVVVIIAVVAIIGCMMSGFLFMRGNMNGSILAFIGTVIVSSSIGVAAQVLKYAKAPISFGF